MLAASSAIAGTHDLRVDHRHERAGTTGIGAVAETEPLGVAIGEAVHAPAGRAVGEGGRAEDVLVAAARPAHLVRRPGFVRPADAREPPCPVERKDAGLVAFLAHRSHHVPAARADIRAGQQRAREQRRGAVAA